MRKRLTKKQLRAIFAKANAQVDGYDVEFGIKKSRTIPSRRMEERPVILNYKKNENFKSSKKSKSYGSLGGKDIRKIIEKDKFLKKYKDEDFVVKESEPNTYRFSSKDGRIEANLFWRKGDVELRGLVYDTKTGVITKTFGAAYPFAYSAPKASQQILQNVKKSIANQLNQGNYKSL